jgi:antitoxin VapB
MDRASVFMNGRSQAVRLPMSCRFGSDVKSLSVRKVGNSVILEPIETTGWSSAYWAALEAMPEMVEEVREIELDIPDIEGI